MQFAILFRGLTDLQGSVKPKLKICYIYSNLIGAGVVS